MGMKYGNNQANEGMSKLVYQYMDQELSPPLQQAVNDAPDAATKEGAQTALDDARKAWKKLAYAISRGVIEHLISDLEIKGVKTSGDVSTTVSGQTALQDGHQHNVNLTGTDNNVEFTQSNDGTGLIE